MTHQRFRESKIQVEMLPPKGFKANLTDQLFQAFMQESVMKWRFWLISPETGPPRFREAQIDDATLFLRNHVIFSTLIL